MALPFDEHGSTMILDMMRSMSFLTGLGLGCRQHSSRQFIATVDHDTTEVDYRYMVFLCNERLRARLFHMPFDYPVHLCMMSLVDYFVRALEA